MQCFMAAQRDHSSAPACSLHMPLDVGRWQQKHGQNSVIFPARPISSCSLGSCIVSVIGKWGGERNVLKVKKKKNSFFLNENCYLLIS